MSTPERRSRRRVVIVATIVLTLSAVAATYWVRQVRLDDAARAGRDAGRAALEAGDYPAALDGVGTYVERFADRGAVADDYVLYARARRHVELPNGRHLIGAIWSLRKALELDPKCGQARSDLVDLYVEAGYVVEALALIDKSLAVEAGNVGFLRTKRDLLAGLHRIDEALSAARRVEDLAPDDLTDRFHTLRLLTETNKPVAEVDAWTERVVKAHADDPRYGLLRAAAFARRHDDARAKAALDAVLAATKDAADAPFVALLVAELDAAGRFDDSSRVLERAGGASDPAVRAEVVRRLWYADRAAEIVASFERRGEDAQDAADAEQQTLRALALRRIGRDADSQDALAKLSSRADSVSRAWSAFARHAVAPTASDPATDLASLSAAAAAVPGSALIRGSLGDAYARAGETDLALESWTVAAAKAPSWAAPLTRMARTLLLTGRGQMALTMARAALLRSPNDVDVVRTYVAAVGSAAGELDRRQADSLLSAVSTVEKAAPECADDALSLRVDVLSRVDPAAAADRLRAVVESKTKTGETTYLRLADAAARSDAQLAGRILDLCESVHGVTPQLALARATRALQEHGAAAGMDAFEGARSRSRPSDDPLEWDLARATFVDAAGGREAGATWIALADAHPDTISAQLGALGSEAAWRDRDAVARLIERLRGLTGERGVTWRVGRARWLLTTPSAPQAQTAEAAQILDDVVRAAPRSASTHALLAGALERLGNVAGAEEHLRIAADLAPEDASIAIEVARLAQLRGRGDSSRREIDRVLAQRNLPPAQMERVAYILAVQGDLRRGVAILEPFVADGRARREGAVLLARLHARLGEPARALAVCERLLASPDAEVVELAASQYAALGRDAEAAATLARLDALTLPAGTRELVLARFAAAQGRAEAADEFRRCVDAAPSRADAWTAYLTWAVSTGATDRVGEILDDPRAAAIEPVRFLAGARATWTAAIRTPRTRALVVAAIRDVGDRPVLLDALRATERGDGSPAGAADAARAVRTLADANVKVLALQLLAADLAASAGDVTGARRTAERTSAAFPDSAAAARQAAELAARDGRWPEALSAGRRWRDRASRLDEDAETFVAEALTRTGRAADAVAALEPRIAAALGDCGRHEPMLIVFAASVLRSGDAKRAVDLISRLSRGADRRRSALIGVDPGLLGDAAGAARWLAACAEQTPATDVAARVELARAWSRAWNRHGAPELLAAAKDVLAGLTASPDAPAAAHLLSASLAQQEGDLAAARSGYVAALARDPRMDEARNNLAMVLADLGQWKDAVAEATKTTSSSPAVPEYLDTLAYALRKGRQFDDARVRLDAAIRLDPANPRWMASLAETLSEGGDAAGAAKAAARAEAMAADRGGLDPDVRDRIARLAHPR